MTGDGAFPPAIREPYALKSGAAEPSAVESSAVEPSAVESSAVESFPVGEPGEGPGLTGEAVAEEGSWVVLFGGHDDIASVKLEAGKVFQYRSGKFWHDDIIGARFGTRIYDRKTCRQSAVLLRLTPELRTNCLAHRTQVVYAPDLAVASMLLDCNHGRVIVESGTGSGSATLSFARSVGPTGHVHTFENNKARARHAVQEFQQLGVRNVSCYVTDVYRDGFLQAEIRPLEPETLPGVEPASAPIKSCKQLGVKPLGPGSADGVFLDLPSPWLAFAHADHVLRPHRRLVVFSPCHEQITEMGRALRAAEYQDLGCMEVILKPWGVFTASDATRKLARTKQAQQSNFDEGRCTKAATELAVDPKSVFDISPHVFYQIGTRGHTGYLLVGTKPPTDEQNVDYTIPNAPCRFRPHTHPKKK